MMPNYTVGVIAGVVQYRLKNLKDQNPEYINITMVNLTYKAALAR